MPLSFFMVLSDITGFKHFFLAVELWYLVNDHQSLVMNSFSPKDHLNRFMYLLLQTRYCKVPNHKDSLCCSDINTPTSLLTALTLHTKSLTTAKMFFISIILSFQRCCIHGIIQYVTFENRPFKKT